MVRVEERGTSYSLFRARDKQTFFLVVVFEVGRRVVNGIFLNVHGNFRVFRKEVVGSDEEAPGLSGDDHLAFVVDGDLGQRVALSGAVDGSAPHFETAHVVNILVKVLHGQRGVFTGEAGVGGLLFGSRQQGLLLQPSGNGLRKQLRIVEKRIVGHHAGETQVDGVGLQLGSHVGVQAGAVPRDHSSVGVEFQFVRVIAPVDAAHNQAVLRGIAPKVDVLEIEVGFLGKSQVVGEPHGHPFHVVALVQNVVLEKVLVQFHFPLEKGGTLPDVEVQDLPPSFGLVRVLALQEGVVSVYQTLEMRNRAVFFLHHLVGRVNEYGLVLRVYAGGPHQLEGVQDSFSFLLAVLRHGCIKLLHLLHRFGRIFGKGCKTLCLR